MSRSRPTFNRQRLILGVAVLLSLVVSWLLARPRSEIERTRRHFVELQRQLSVLQHAARRATSPRTRINERQDARASERRSATTSNTEAVTSPDQKQAPGAAQTRAADADVQTRADGDASATADASRTFWSDTSAVRQAVLAAPLVTLPGVPPVADVTPVFSTNRAGCASCHVAVATPGYESFPEPFRTHVQLSSYVGADSPHPPSRTGCALCHLGADDGETFKAAGHSTLRALVRADMFEQLSADGVDARPFPDAGEWTDVKASGAMLPSGRTAAACARCHAGERYQPGATALNDAVATLDRAGCYACHAVSGLERAPTRGPDLRRVKGKLTPEWVRQWIAEPTAIKPATWMPRFWWDRRVLASDDRAEVDAVVAYLFVNSDAYVPAVAAPPRGDAGRGQRLVETVGCLGCHVVGAADRDSVSLARTFGPPLQAIGSKTTYAWLYDWLRDPSRYSPNTRMPRMRLSDAEAADVATYLQTLTHEPLDIGAPILADAEPYRAVVRRYAAFGAPVGNDVGQLPVDAAKLAAGRAVIQVRGCFNCHEIRGFEDRRTTMVLSEDVAHPGFGNQQGTDPPVPNSHLLPRRPAVREAGTIVGDMNPQRFRTNAAADIVRPSYSFGPNEMNRVVLGAAAAARAAREARSITVPWHVAKVTGRTLMQQHNCTGCHVVDGTGGDVAAAVSATGSAAAAAPSLTDEGARVNLPWLRGFLREPTRLRPGLTLRMPTFALTGDEIEVLSRYFQAIAPAGPAPSGAPAAATGRTAATPR